MHKFTRDAHKSITHTCFSHCARLCEGGRTVHSGLSESVLSESVFVICCLYKPHLLQVFKSRGALLLLVLVLASFPLVVLLS